MNEKANGVIEHPTSGRKANHLFRVSMKSIICNDDGQVLVVKETGRTWWDLPGGGMDHGEDIRQAIARELYEEVLLTGDFAYDIIAIENPALLERSNVWQVRLVFNVKPVSMNFGAGEDADEVRFIDPATLKDSTNLVERKVYEYSQLLHNKFG